MHAILTEIDGGDPAAIADATVTALLALAASPAIDAALSIAARRCATARTQQAQERGREAARARLLEQLAALDRVA